MHQIKKCCSGGCLLCFEYIDYVLSKPGGLPLPVLALLVLITAVVINPNGGHVSIAVGIVVVVVVGGVWCRSGEEQGALLPSGGGGSPLLWLLE